MTMQQKDVSYLEKFTTVHPGDNSNFKILLDSRSYNGFDIILPQESKLVTPCYRTVHTSPQKPSILFEGFSHDTPEWQPEEKAFGKTRHDYFSIFEPGHKTSLVESGHYHKVKKERIMGIAGAALCLAQPVDNNGNLTGSLEAILLHSIADEIPEEKGELKLYFVGIGTMIAHTIINPLQYTPAIIHILAQKGYDAKNPDMYFLKRA